MSDLNSRKKTGIAEAIKKMCILIWQPVCVSFAGITGMLFRILFLLQWYFPFTKSPLYFDHRISVYGWKNGKDISWVERGVLNYENLILFKEPRVLELGCGDGFYSAYFYSKCPRAQIVACDLDEEAIKTANHIHRKDNVRYIVADFKKNMPCKNTDLTNVIWDASINFFNDDEKKELLSEIAQRLNRKKGILSGLAVVEIPGKKTWKEFHSAFRNEEELRVLLGLFFKRVKVFRGMRVDELVFFSATDGDYIL